MEKLQLQLKEEHEQMQRKCQQQYQVSQPPTIQGAAFQLHLGSRLENHSRWL